MFLKHPKTRKFTYRPMFYKPPEEEAEDRKIKFRRYSHSKAANRRSLLVMILLAVIILFLFFYWRDIKKSDRKEFKFENIIIEELK